MITFLSPINLPPQVHINNNCDPIFKNYEITVDGEFYKPYNFIKILKNIIKNLFIIKPLEKI